MGFCVCNPQDKKNRVASDKMCCVHRRFVCEDCVADPSQKPCHLTCTIKNYSDWVRDAYHEHPVKCALSGEEITEEKPFVRLTCFCLFYEEPLRKYLSDVDVPRDEIKCPRCSALIYAKLHHKRSLLRTKLAKLLDTITVKQPPQLKSATSTTTSTTSSNDRSDHERKAVDSAQGATSTPSTAPPTSAPSASGAASSSVHYAELQSRHNAANESSSSSQSQGDLAGVGVSTMRKKNRGDDSVIDIGDDDGVLSDADHQPKPRRLPPRPIRAWVRGGSSVSIRTVVLTIMLCAIIGLFASPFVASLWSSFSAATEAPAIVAAGADGGAADAVVKQVVEAEAAAA